jgi:hypothetical protein
MSKVLYACSRYHPFSESTERKLVQICDELVPDNVKKCPKHKIYVKGHLSYAITMNKNPYHESDKGLLLGILYEKPEANWLTPRHYYPDGNYALFRNGDDEIEVVSDCVGSRTIWYYHDDELFVAATSQRAIILFLGTFLFDKRVIPWMLSTGTLGPQFSWDSRLHRLPVDSSLLLDKKTWALSLNQNPVNFFEIKRSREEHKGLLTETIRRSVRYLESVDFKHWILPLSGGYDSRAILCFIKEQIGIPEELKAVTWGLEESLNEDESDASVAQELACHLGVQHDYYHTDISPEPIESIIDRFIFCGEGRIDNIAGYMDGMEIWRQFHDRDITGVIRGDQGFGDKKMSSEIAVKQFISCALCADFENLRNVIEDFELPSQQLPPELIKREQETISTWRDRLHHSYKLPIVMAALSDIKLSYVEQINPLLSKAILNTTKSFPDNLRTDKTLFKEVINAIGPNIPFAKMDGSAKQKDILRYKPFVDLLKCEISSDYAHQLFGAKFVKYICDGIMEVKPITKTRKQKVLRLISSILPPFIKNILPKNIVRPNVDSYILAFRVLILIKMHKTLKAAAAKSGG